MRLKFDLALIENYHTRGLYLEWFKDFNVDWKNTVWVEEEGQKNCYKIYVRAEVTGRKLYTERAYFRPFVSVRELDEWM